jgi:hypothetical protein
MDDHIHKLSPCYRPGVFVSLYGAQLRSRFSFSSGLPAAWELLEAQHRGTGDDMTGWCASTR